MGLAIGQNLFIAKLQTAVLEYTDAVSPAQVIAVGAVGLTTLASSPAILSALRHAYSDSIPRTFILALAAACIAFPPSLAMEWVNIKHVAKGRLDGGQGQSDKDVQVVTVEQDPEAKVAGP